MSGFTLALRRRAIKHLVVLIVCWVLAPLGAFSQNNVLYGLTYDGVLEEVMTSTAATYARRAALPSGQYRGLIYVNGKFYTYNSAGVLYRFGFQNGDEEVIGTTSYSVRGLAVRSDGQVFASVAGSLDDSIGTVNLSTGAITNLHQLYSCTGQNIWYRKLYGLAFYSNGELLATAFNPDANSCCTFFFRINVDTGETYGRKVSDACSPDHPPAATISGRFFSGLAIHPDYQRVFAASGYATGSSYYPFFYEFLDAYPHPEDSSATFIGFNREAAEYSAPRDIRSLTFGPPNSADELDLLPSWYEVLLAY